jgi:hypothetical protein
VDKSLKSPVDGTPGKSEGGGRGKVAQAGGSQGDCCQNENFCEHEKALRLEQKRRFATTRNETATRKGGSDRKRDTEPPNA